MDNHLFVSMVGPISPLSVAMHPPMFVGPLLHCHPTPSQCGSCWLLLWCPTLVTSTLTMDRHLFLSMVGPTWPLPIAMHSFVAVSPFLHGPLLACCTGSQHAVGCCGVSPLVSQHSPWVGTCFSPWLVPPVHCWEPCTHLLLGIHSYMARCMLTRLAVSILLVAVVLHFCCLIIHHGQASVCLHGWPHLSTVKCHAPSYGCGSTPPWPPCPLPVCLLLVAVVVSHSEYLHTHHGEALVSPHGWSYLTTAKCHALTCGCESIPTWPPACLLYWQSACWWLLWCPTPCISTFTMDGHMFLPMVGPTCPLLGALHPPAAGNPPLHGQVVAD
jgi:hypothetical protein